MLDLTADPIALTAALVDIPSESRHEQLIADEIEAALNVDDIRKVAHPALRHRVLLNFEGEAEGVDKDAREAAKALGVPVVRFPITDDDWAQHGKGAGPRRNRDMLNGFTRFSPIEPAEAVLAERGASSSNDSMPFWRIEPAEAVLAERGGDGTADMVRQARAAGLPVIDLADPATAAALAPYQRWTKDDGWLVRSDRRR